MRWKYLIPHTWKFPRETWADVLLLPDDPEYKGDALMLTIDALGDLSKPSIDEEEEEFRKDALEKLGSKDYWVGVGRMIVRVKDFNKEEFLNFVKIWFDENGLDVSELIETTIEDFKGKHAMADLIITLQKSYPGEKKEKMKKKKKKQEQH